MNNLDAYIFEDGSIKDIISQFQTADFNIHDNGDYKKLTVIFKINDKNSSFKIKKILIDRFGDAVCFDNPFYLTSELLFASHLKIATVESCTGGLIAHNLINFAGSSAYYDRGFITYSNKSKIDLGVDEETIEKYGAVSEETAALMASACINKADADISISSTGVAGPEASRSKPVGLVWFGVVFKNKTYCYKANFSGSRNNIRAAAAYFAINIVRKLLLK